MVLLLIAYAGRYHSIVNEVLTQVRKIEESLLKLKRSRKGEVSFTTVAVNCTKDDIFSYNYRNTTVYDVLLYVQHAKQSVW